MVIVSSIFTLKWPRGANEIMKIMNVKVLCKLQTLHPQVFLLKSYNSSRQVTSWGYAYKDQYDFFCRCSWTPETFLNSSCTVVEDWCTMNRGEWDVLYIGLEQQDVSVLSVLFGEFWEVHLSQTFWYPRKFSCTLISSPSYLWPQQSLLAFRVREVTRYVLSQCLCLQVQTVNLVYWLGQCANAET